MINLETISKKIHAWFGEKDILNFSKPNAEEVKKEYWDVHSLSSLLPYEAYSEESNLFLNRNSIGFMLKASPLLGASEEMINILFNLVVDRLNPKIDAQVILRASDKIGSSLDYYAAMRSGKNPDFQWLAEKRTEFLKEGAHRTLSEMSGAVLRNFELYFVFSMKRKKRDESMIDELLQVRDDVLSTFQSIGIHTDRVDVFRFLQYMRDFLNPNTSVYPSSDTYHELDSLNIQMADPETKVIITPRQLEFEHAEASEPNMIVSALSLKDTPKQLASWQMGETIGQMFNNTQQISCPFYISFHFRLESRETSIGKANLKFHDTEKDAKSVTSKFKPSSFKEVSDWKFIQERMSNGDRLVKTFFQVLIIDTPKNIVASERKVKNLYQANGWELRKSFYCQHHNWLSAMPFMMTEGIFEDFKVLGRLRTFNAYAAVNMSPIQGEWKGTRTPLMTFSGRRGQVTFWNPFDNEVGNYNVAISGSSGQGKSVFTQDYIMSILGVGGRVWVIDVGFNYEKTCQLLKGEFIQFDPNQPICINPFTNIEDIHQALEMLKPMFGFMARPSGHITDEELSFIEQAIKATWDQYKQDASVTLVSTWLKNHPNRICQNLSDLLFSYTADGMFGAFFEGKSKIQFNNQFVVIELQHLKSKKDLQQIVLLNTIYQIHWSMYLSDRSQYKTCIIDEAWEFLDGQNAQIAKFIESGFRTVRRHNGNFVTITQSINDYYKSDCALAAYENSSHQVIFRHEAQSLDNLKTSGKLTLDGYTERLYKSIQSQRDYSEFIVKTGGGLAVARLMLDPYARIQMSSKGHEFQAVRDLVAQGMSLKDAIARVANHFFKQSKLSR